MPTIDDPPFSTWLLQYGNVVNEFVTAVTPGASGVFPQQVTLKVSFDADETFDAFPLTVPFDYPGNYYVALKNFDFSGSGPTITAISTDGTTISISGSNPGDAGTGIFELVAVLGSLNEVPA